MPDRTVKADNAWIENARVDYDGEIFIFVHHSRELRNGRYTEESVRIKLDVDSIACFRRTLRNLAEEAIDKQKKHITRQESNLADS